MSGKGKKGHLTTGSYYSVGVLSRNRKDFIGVFGNQFPVEPIVAALEDVMNVYAAGITPGQPVGHLK
jgi:hypothetical protein